MIAFEQGGSVSSEKEKKEKFFVGAFGGPEHSNSRLMKGDGKGAWIGTAGTETGREKVNIRSETQRFNENSESVTRLLKNLICCGKLQKI